MINKDLTELQKVKGEACVSVIVPTHNLSPERRIDKLEVQRAIDKAKHVLESKYPIETIRELEHKLDQLVNSIDFVHDKKGVGIFVSPSVKKLVKFPFAVKEKVVVKESFEIRDLIYLDNYSSEYYLIEITEKSARLFKGAINELEEIKDENFPKKDEDLYEYSRPKRGRSSYGGHAFVKEFEKDKSIMEEIRMKEFFNKINEYLQKYLLHDTPLLIAGTEKDISLFESVTNYKKNIIGMITGNSTYTPAHELGMLAWLKMWAYTDDKKLGRIKTYQEKVGEGLGVEGIKDVWEAAEAGRGLKLLVEKDFSATAFVNHADNTLHVEIPGTKYTIIPDVIEDIIETVLNKDGDVIIVENGFLKDHEKIALITRY